MTDFTQAPNDNQAPEKEKLSALERIMQDLIGDHSMTAKLLPILNKMAGHRVLCVGDIMLDRFVYGAVDRISPEAPIPVLRIQRETTPMGGAGNVLRNILSLSGKVDMIGVIGKDHAGYNLADQISKMDGAISHLITDPSRPTTTKTRYVASGQQILRADDEVSAEVSSHIEDQILLRAENAMLDAKIVILSDYAKGVLTPRVIRGLIDMARNKGLRVLIDPKGRDFSRYRGATLLTPNRKELSEATGKTIKTVADAESAARELIAAHDLDGIMAKLGGDGVCLVLKDMPVWHFRAATREVYDVSGAGDTVVSALALALAGGACAEDAAALSNIAGSIVVSKIGTATVTREEIAHELVRDQARSAEEKILGLFEIAERAERWRKQGLKVGFTNGCFDLLHPGHLSLIRQARATCDRLIVAVNSDTSIKRIKGEDRPIQNEMARTAVLAALADVDAVVVFEEDTPVEAIKAIRPAVIVKGAEYKTNEVIGGELVESWGGEIVLAKMVNGESTTSTIERMSGASA